MGKPATEEIKEFLARVQQRFKPEKVVLFGSRASGDHLKHSDYDIIVVSPCFEGYNFLDRLAMLYELWDGDLHLDVLAYTPEEFEQKKAEIGIVAEAIRDGIQIGDSINWM